MTTESGDRKDHVFRLASPPARSIREAEKRFAAEHREEFRRWAEYWRHKHVIQEALAKELFGKMEIDPRVKASLKALRESRDSRLATVRDAPFSGPGPPIFQTKPGLNILGPPYDFGLHVALGGNPPAVMNVLKTGQFSVVATATAGQGTYGAAGVGLFIVPSQPSRTLAIRPYFEWQYIYSCESHGPPTAHSTGVVSANVSGRRPDGESKPFPGKGATLWTASSDAWDDDHGSDANVFLNPDSELIVSGFDFYTVSYACQANGNAANPTASGWWASAYVRLHCRVPFIFVEEF
jgi:hypothetical protein